MVRRSMDEPPVNCPDCGLPFDDCVCGSEYEDLARKVELLTVRVNEMMDYMNRNGAHNLFQKIPEGEE